MIYRDITGVVLAGGRSSRMGQDKALMEWQGKPLVQHAVDILRQVCHTVIIGSNRKDYLFTGCEIWPDEFAVQAPMIGIYSCLKRSRDAWIMVLTCDMPFVDARLFEYLLSHMQQYDAILPIHSGNTVEPLCGLYNHSAIPLMEKCIEAQQYSMQQFARKSSHRFVSVGPFLDFFHADLFFNMNTPGDFNRLK